jgi:hypothetical protein
MLDCRQLRERRTQAAAQLAALSHRRGAPPPEAAGQSPSQQRKAATVLTAALKGVSFLQGDFLQLVRARACLHLPARLFSPLWGTQPSVSASLRGCHEGPCRLHLSWFSSWGSTMASAAAAGEQCNQLYIPSNWPALLDCGQGVLYTSLWPSIAGMQHSFHAQKK